MGILSICPGKAIQNFSKIYGIIHISSGTGTLEAQNVITSHRPKLYFQIKEWKSGSCIFFLSNNMPGQMTK